MSAVALIEEPDELERRGARVDEQRVAVIDELDGALRDGLLGGDVDIDAAILRGDSQTLVERYGATMRAAQRACFGERVQVGYLHRGIMLKHFHDGGTTLIGEGSGCCVGHSCSILGQICRNCVDSIFVHFLFE